MKKSHFEKLITDAGRQITLSEEKRAHMRSMLTEYVAFKPAVAQTTPSFGSVLMNMLAALSRPAFATVAAVLVIAVTSGSAAFASENTIPGDALYGFKVAVAEPVRALLTSSPEAKAEIYMEFAERRIDEAATLAKKGKLNAKIEEDLAGSFTKHVSAAAHTIAVTGIEDPEEAQVSSNRFATRLLAYEKVLEQVDTGAESIATAKFQTVIRERIALADEEPVEDTASVAMAMRAESTPSAAPTIKATLKLKTATDKALRSSANLIGTSDKELDASSSAGAHRELKNAEAFAEKGRRLLEQNDTEGASMAFQNSLSTAAQLEVFTHAAAHLKINTFGAAATTSASGTAITSSSQANKKHVASETQAVVLVTATSTSSTTPAEQGVMEIEVEDHEKIQVDRDRSSPPPLLKLPRIDDAFDDE